MNLIVCIDNNGGMLFNHRRQSKDIEVINDIINKLGTNTLYINEFSTDLFIEKFIENEYICVEENLLNIKYKDNDYCFLENINPSQLLNKVSKIIIYKWNRDYPADTFFDINIENWRKEIEIEMKGYSHEVINRCEYVRGQ